MKKKLIPKATLQLAEKVTDSLKHRKSKLGDKRYDMELFCEARDTYLSWEPIRNTRLRNQRYTFADQWGDLVEDDKGELVPERKRIHDKNGGIVLQNNHMFKVLNSMSGIYVKSMGKPVVFALQENSDTYATMMTNAIQCNYENNEENELLTNALLEVLTGGIAIVDEEWSVHNGIEDAYTYPVDTGYFAFRSKGNDPRLWDIDLMVEIRDYTRNELKAKYAETAEECATLDYIYNQPFNNLNPGMPDVDDHQRSAGWDLPISKNLCRTYIVWKQEVRPEIRCVDYLDFEEPVFRVLKSEWKQIEAENEKRKKEYIAMGITDETNMILIEKVKEIESVYWHCTIFGPDGIILDEHDSEMESGEPPYTICAHHFVNGKVYPFMSLIVDQQRYINRLITLQDMLINSSIKGLKMVPKTMLGGLTPKQFARQAVEVGGWIFYEPDERFPNLAPTVIQTSSHDVGVSEFLKVQLANIDEITNMSAAMRGAQPNSGTPAARYALETENSITSLASTFGKFNNFENRIAKKKLKVIHQNYRDPRRIALRRTSGLAEYCVYDPKAVENLQFDVVVRQAPDTPVARMTNNDLFKELWLRGVLTAKQMLDYSDLPGTEQLKHDLETMEEQGMPTQAQPLQGNQAAMEATQEANPTTVQAIQEALRSDLGGLTQI